MQYYQYAGWPKNAFMASSLPKQTCGHLEFTMWEIFTLAKDIPYEDMQDEELVVDATQKLPRTLLALVQFRITCYNITHTFSTYYVLT